MTVLIETIRVMRGVAPLRLDHMARLALSCHQVGLPLPSPDDGVALDKAIAATDGVLRVTWDGTALHTSQRAVDDAAVHLKTVRTLHAPYPYKTEDRMVFEAAVREVPGAEPLLLNARGQVTETSRFALLWVEQGELCATDRILGVLPSVGVDRVADLEIVRFRRRSRHGWPDGPLAVVNAVRGVVPVESLDGERVVGDARWAAIQAEFWRPPA